MGNTSGNCQLREGTTPSAPDEMDAGGVMRPLTSGGGDMMVKTKATKGPMNGGSNAVAAKGMISKTGSTRKRW